MILIMSSYICSELYHVPAVVLSILHRLSQIVFIRTLAGRYCYSPNFQLQKLTYKVRQLV